MHTSPPLPTATRAAPFQLGGGAVRVFAAELLILPTGLVTAAVLTRALGPGRYGLFSLAASFAAWAAWTTTALLSRAAIKLVSEAADSKPVATSVLRWRLAVGSTAAVLAVIAAPLIASVLRAPSLTPYLRAFAADLLLFNLARAYRDVLTGTGHFAELAVVAAARWIARAVLIVALVVLTRSVMAAVVGSIGATAVELIVARCFQQVPLRGRPGVTARDLWTLAAPLFIYGAAIQLFARMDLFALSALGGSAVETGYYAAAQNLAVPPGLFAMALAPLLLATLGRLRSRREYDQARRSGRDALRVTIALVPAAAIVAGSAREVTTAIFGGAYHAAAPLLALLFSGAVALSVAAVAAAILTAEDHTRMVSRIGVGILATAGVGHLVLIPRFGALGAATATAGAAVGGAAASLILLQCITGVRVSGTLARALAVAVPVYLAATRLPTAGVPTLVGKVAALGAAAVGALLLLGELDAAERARLRRLLLGAGRGAGRGADRGAPLARAGSDHDIRSAAVLVHERMAGVALEGPAHPAGPSGAATPAPCHHP